MKGQKVHPAHKAAARKAAKTRARIRRTAIHEAGHAVIGRALGLPCGHATIRTRDYDGGSAGHGIIHSPDEIQRLWWKFEDVAHRTEAAAFRARILAYMAGCEAEKVCLGRRGRVGDADDRRQIDLMFDSLLPRDADIVRIARRMRATTRHLVRRHRATIKQVAALLLRHGSLSPAQIDRAMPKSRGALRSRRARLAKQADIAAARRGEAILV